MMTVRPDVDAGRETAPGVVRSAALTSSPSSPSPSTGGSWLVRVAAVAVLYLMTAKIGFALAIDPGNHIAPVWLPSGIALGSLLLWGPRLWPGIWLGSFLANTWLYKGAAVGTTDVLVAMGLAVGSVLQARVGAGLLTRWTGGRDVFDRTGDLGTFGLVGIVVCGISSTLGVLTLCAAGSVEWATFGESWLTWWLGDVVGALVATPLMLAWGLRAPVSRGGYGEMAGLVAALLVASLATLDVSAVASGYPRAFVLFPCLIWAALRFNRRVVTLAIVVAAWAPIVWVVQVPGPFAETGSAPLVVLQTYVGIISMTTLTLFASVTERHHAQLSGAATRERLVEQGAALTRMVTAETMGSSDCRTSLRRITAEVSATLRAERVGVWLTSDDGSTMRCIEQCERGAGHSEGGVLSATDYPRYWQALRAKAAISADDAVSDPRTSEFAETYLIPYGITSMLDAIVCAGEGQPSGVLCVEHVGPPRHWETDEETFARSAAALVAQVLAGSARREAELALLERERRHRSVTESLSEGLLITNLDDVVEDVNPQMLSMTGYTREELVGRRAVDVLVPPEARDRLKGRNRVRAAGRAEHYEQRLRRKDGTEFWALIAGSPLRDAEGVVIGTVGANLDITERKRAEEATRASEERYRSLVEHMGEGLIQVDEGDFIQLVNPKICRMLGYSEAEMLGQHASTLLNREEDRAAMAARNRRRLDGVAEGYEVQLRKKSGEFLTVWNTATPVVSAEGRSVGSMAIITDITERKRADAERQRLEAMLRQSQKLEAVGTLAGGIAHGFNNLLGTVSGNLSLALQDVPAGHPARESLDQIGQACARATDLVRQILAFSRNDVLEKRALDVRTSVDETVRLLRATLPAGVDLVVQVGDGVPNVLADPTGIQQVLLNVCTNAWHAMAGQPGRITIRLDGVTFEAEQAIGHAALGPGRYVRLSVSDTGAGMDRATLERIFDPFFTTKGVGKGTGLGLSVVHGIMEHHGGTVSVTSQPGKGSTFDLYFPAIAQVVAEPLPAFQLGPRRGQGERILFLDDERPLVDMATRVLEREGFRVSGFTSPVDAVAALRADPMAFDLLVTDQNMPAVAGIDVAREAHGIRADLPVVLTSGNVTPELQRLASAAGVLEILSKPYGTGSFAQLVATLVHAER